MLTNKENPKGQSRRQVSEMMSTGVFSKKRDELSSQPSLPGNDYKISQLMTPAISQH